MNAQPVVILVCDHATGAIERLPMLPNNWTAGVYAVLVALPCRVVVL